MKNIAFLHQYFFPFATWGLLAGLVPHAQIAGEDWKLELRALQGQLLLTYSIPLESTRIALTLPELSNGIYWLVLKVPADEPQVQKLVIQH